ncbi:MAG: hypothetical protein N2510_08235 [Ignavibacteria bacterium]|nr:hypothetical protein [Ignavibacteria bacterium]
MENVKLIRLLKSFSEDEFRRFGNYLRSLPGTRTFKLYKAIKSQYPEFRKFDKTKLYGKIYNGRKYNDKTMKNLMSEMITLTEEFLISDYLNRNRFEKLFIKAEVYREKNLPDSLNSVTEKLSKEADTKFNSVTCYENQEKLMKLKAHYENFKNNFEGFLRQKTKIYEYSFLSFLIKLFRRMREEVIMESGYNIKADNVLINALKQNIQILNLLETLRETKNKDYTLLKIYYLTYACLADFENEELFKELKTLVTENFSLFDETERYYLFNDLISYCVEKSRREQSDYSREEFEIYKLMLEKDSFRSGSDEKMSVILYRNIMLLALSLGEIRWLKEFSENYTKYLSDELQDSMKNLLTAHVLFEEKKYSEALDVIKKINYDIFLYKLDIKNLLLKIFYELKMFEQAYSLTDAFSHFLANTNEVSDAMKIKHRNFIKYYRKLLNSASRYDYTENEFILKQLNSDQSVSNKKWLTDKFYRQITEH